MGFINALESEERGPEWLENATINTTRCAAAGQERDSQARAKAIAMAKAAMPTPETDRLRPGQPEGPVSREHWLPEMRDEAGHDGEPQPARPGDRGKCRRQSRAIRPQIWMAGKRQL